MCPLVLVYIESTKDWGDDFAAYFEEAKNITEHRPFYYLHYRFFDYNDHYAPPYYSVGYPLLLAPAVALAGLDMYLLNLYMSLWMMVWALLTIVFLRRYFRVLSVGCFVLIFFLNPWFFEFKGRVLSDVPFSFFFLLTIFLYTGTKQNIFKWVMIGICVAIAICIRSIGIVLMLAMCIDTVVSFLRRSELQQWQQKLYKPAIIIITALFVLGMFQMLFPAPGHSYYIRQFNSLCFASVRANVMAYISLFSSFFGGDSSRLPVLAHFIGWAMLVILAVGVISAIRVERNIIFWLFWFYMLIVFLFPDMQGFRYLLPVVPLIMYLLARAARFIKLSSGISKNWPFIVPVILIAFKYSFGFVELTRKEKKALTYGPFAAGSQHCFAEMKGIVPPSALIACVSPRVVGLMTMRPCCIIPEGNTSRQVTKLAISRPTYLLAIEERDPEIIVNIASAHGDSLIWQHDGFRLYECKVWK